MQIDLGHKQSRMNSSATRAASAEMCLDTLAVSWPSRVFKVRVAVAPLQLAPCQFQRDKVKIFRDSNTSSVSSAYGFDKTVGDSL